MQFFMGFAACCHIIYITDYKTIFLSTSKTFAIGGKVYFLKSNWVTASKFIDKKYIPEKTANIN